MNYICKKLEEQYGYNLIYDNYNHWVIYKTGYKWINYQGIRMMVLKNGYKTRSVKRKLTSSMPLYSYYICGNTIYILDNHHCICEISDDLCLGQLCGPELDDYIKCLYRIDSAKIKTFWVHLLQCTNYWTAIKHDVVILMLLRWLGDMPKYIKCTIILQFIMRP